MKKITKICTALTLAFFLHAATPALAQNDNNAGTTTTASTNDNDDDHSNWGLLGLAGLLGLLGLRKRDDKHIHVERRNESSSSNR